MHDLQLKMNKLKLKDPVTTVASVNPDYLELPKEKRSKAAKSRRRSKEEFDRYCAGIASSPTWPKYGLIVPSVHETKSLLGRQSNKYQYTQSSYGRTSYDLPNSEMSYSQDSRYEGGRRATVEFAEKTSEIGHHWIKRGRSSSCPSDVQYLRLPAFEPSSDEEIEEQNNLAEDSENYDDYGQKDAYQVSCYRPLSDTMIQAMLREALQSTDRLKCLDSVIISCLSSLSSIDFLLKLLTRGALSNQQMMQEVKLCIIHELHNYTAWTLHALTTAIYARKRMCADISGGENLSFSQLLRNTELLHQ